MKIYVINYSGVVENIVEISFLLNVTEGEKTFGEIVEGERIRKLR